MNWIKEGQEIVREIQEKEILKENPNTRVKSALLGDDERIQSFAIGTPENPMDWEILEDPTKREIQQRAEENNKRRKEFEKELKRMREEYKEIQKDGFVKVGGFYNSPEHSYFIVNPRIDEMKNLFKIFGQESFIFGIRDKQDGTMTYQYWERENIDDDFKKTEESKKIVDESDAKQFFTQLHNFKFNIYFKKFNESIQDLEKQLEEYSNNGEYFKRLERQVYGKDINGYNRMMNRLFMYETLESKKERENRLNPSD